MFVTVRCSRSCWCLFLTLLGKGCLWCFWFSWLCVCRGNVLWCLLWEFGWPFFKCQACMLPSLVRVGNTADVLLLIVWLFIQIWCHVLGVGSYLFYMFICWQKNDYILEQTVVLSSPGVFLSLFVSEAIVATLKKERWSWCICCFDPPVWCSDHFSFCTLNSHLRPGIFGPHGSSNFFFKFIIYYFPYVSDCPTCCCIHFSQSCEIRL